MMPRLPIVSVLAAALMTACASVPEATALDNVPTPRVKPQNMQSPTLIRERNAKYAAWKQAFVREAIAKGYEAALVRKLIMPAKINEKALDRDRSQPEFTKPIWSYVDNAVNSTRLNNGRRELAGNTQTFDGVESRYRVDRHYLTAIWGLESAYGEIMGDYNIIDALSTFAFDGRRTAFGERELYGILDAVSQGYVRPEQLKGSWAGAMGMVQFIPTTFRDYAVDFNNDGNRDIWGTNADALGSAAHYLSRHGWILGQPAIVEVTLPDGFDYRFADGRTERVNDWAALSVAPINGERWTADAGFLEAKLLVPAGHKGPKFLTFKNFDVIKKYNKSTSYALGITSLAEALAGRKAITTPWPRADKPLSFSEKEQMQRRLTALGFDTGGIDGQVGPATRKAIRAWQQAQGLVADGYMNKAVFSRLMR